VAQLRQLLTEYLRPALIYTVPTFHNPTGATLTAARRRVLVELVAAHNRFQPDPIAVLEDDGYALTRFEGEPLPTLFELSAGAFAYSSSFSAALAPGLRVGYLVLPEPLARELTRAANATYIGPSLLGQATVYEFVRRGALEPHLARLRDELRRRRDALVAALERHFPDGTWSPPAGGFFLWLRLPVGTDGRRLVERAAARFAVPGTAFASTANMLRLSFAVLDCDELAAAVEALAAARAVERPSG
jgi:2-aminoadipate transaminase